MDSAVLSCADFCNRPMVNRFFSPAQGEDPRCQGHRIAGRTTQQRQLIALQRDRRLVHVVAQHQREPFGQNLTAVPGIPWDSGIEPLGKIAMWYGTCYTNCTSGQYFAREKAKEYYNNYLPITIFSELRSDSCGMLWPQSHQSPQWAV